MSTSTGPTAPLAMDHRQLPQHSCPVLGKTTALTSGGLLKFGIQDAIEPGDVSQLTLVQVRIGRYHVYIPERQWAVSTPPSSLPLSNLQSPDTSMARMFVGLIGPTSLFSLPTGGAVDGGPFCTEDTTDQAERAGRRRPTLVGCCCQLSLSPGPVADPRQRIAWWAPVSGQVQLRAVLPHLEATRAQLRRKTGSILQPSSAEALHCGK